MTEIATIDLFGRWHSENTAIFCYLNLSTRQLLVRESFPLLF